MRDISNNQLPLHSVSWVEHNLQMAPRYSIYRIELIAFPPYIYNCSVYSVEHFT